MAGGALLRPLAARLLGLGSGMARGAAAARAAAARALTSGVGDAGLHAAPAAAAAAGELLLSPALLPALWASSPSWGASAAGRPGARKASSCSAFSPAGAAAASPSTSLAPQHDGSSDSAADSSSTSCSSWCGCSSPTQDAGGEAWASGVPKQLLLAGVVEDELLLPPTLLLMLLQQELCRGVRTPVGLLLCDDGGDDGWPLPCAALRSSLQCSRVAVARWCMCDAHSSTEMGAGGAAAADEAAAHEPPPSLLPPGPCARRCAVPLM